MALYGWARLVDQFGDDYAGDRLAALDEVERQLRLALEPGTGLPQADGPRPMPTSLMTALLMTATHPLVRRMAETVAPAGPARPAPVRPGPGQPPRPGRLPVRDVRGPRGLLPAVGQPRGPHGARHLRGGHAQRDAWSDSICTALQLVEHWQDVAEDAIVGRVYLPLEDMRRFGVSAEELVPPPPSYVDRRRPGRSRRGFVGVPGALGVRSGPRPADARRRARHWWPA